MAWGNCWTKREETCQPNSLQSKRKVLPFLDSHLFEKMLGVPASDVNRVSTKKTAKQITFLISEINLVRSLHSLHTGLSHFIKTIKGYFSGWCHQTPTNDIQPASTRGQKNQLIQRYLSDSWFLLMRHFCIVPHYLFTTPKFIQCARTKHFINTSLPLLLKNGENVVIGICKYFFC